MMQAGRLVINKHCQEDPRVGSPPPPCHTRLTLEPTSCGRNPLGTGQRSLRSPEAPSKPGEHEGAKGRAAIKSLTGNGPQVRDQSAIAAEPRSPLETNRGSTRGRRGIAAIKSPTGNGPQVRIWSAIAAEPEAPSKPEGARGGAGAPPACSPASPSSPRSAASAR
jgi:hypothetical protein